jgi:hypothetical protein
MTDPATEIAVRPINHEILGVDGANNLVSQIIPSIAIVNPHSFRFGVLNNVLTFSSTRPTTARLGVFAAKKGPDQRAVILMLPSAGRPTRLMICITQEFEQANADIQSLGWSDPLSPAFVNFCILKHVVNRWGAQIIAASSDIALLYIVRARSVGHELGPFARDGPFVKEVLTQIVSLTANAFSFDRVEAFTYSSGVDEFNVFIPAVAPLLRIAAVYGIDPAQAVPVTKPVNALRRQYLSGETGGPVAGFEFLGVNSWVNEWEFTPQVRTDHVLRHNYLHNRVMPFYVLNLALST